MGDFPQLSSCLLESDLKSKLGLSISPTDGKGNWFTDTHETQGPFQMFVEINPKKRLDF